jgi:hypothetical protein
MGVEEGEEIQTKSIDNIFNKIIVEKFPNLEIKRVIHVHKATEHQTVKTKNKHHQTYHNQNTQYTEQKKGILKAAKAKRHVTYKGKPIRITTNFSTQTLNTRRS